MSRKKTRFWFHNLGSRHGLLPPPIIKVNHEAPVRGARRQEIHKKLGKVKGRSVFYPVEIKPYLELIIDLKDAKGMSFQVIADEPEVQKLLTRLRYLVSTSLFVNPVRWDDYRFMNFRVARRLLVERFGLDTDGALNQLLGRISAEAETLCSNYCRINDQIRNLALQYEEVDKKLEEERKKLFYGASLALKIMVATTEAASESLRKKEIALTEWLDMAEEQVNNDSEESGAGR